MRLLIRSSLLLYFMSTSAVFASEPFSCVDTAVGTTGQNMRVALTVEKGDNQAGTEQVLSVLEKYNIPVVYFVTGRQALMNRDLLKRLSSSPLVTIGNGALKRAPFKSHRAKEQLRSIALSDQYVKINGSDRYFRFPYGESSCPARKVVKDLGYKIVGWTVDSCDWAFSQRSGVSHYDGYTCAIRPENKNDYRGHVVSRLQDTKGGILTLRDDKLKTVGQLDQLIQDLLNSGFSFGSLSDPEFESLLL